LQTTADYSFIRRLRLADSILILYTVSSLRVDHFHDEKRLT